MRQRKDKPENNIPESSVTEARRHHRFRLHYPVEVTFQYGESALRMNGESRNVSTGGLLMKGPWEIPVGTSVKLSLIIRRGHAIRPIHLRTEGKVVRLHSTAPDGGSTIAIQFDAPVTELAARAGALHLRPKYPKRPPTS